MKLRIPAYATIDATIRDDRLSINRRRWLTLIPKLVASFSPMEMALSLLESRNRAIEQHIVIPKDRGMQFHVMLVKLPNLHSYTLARVSSSTVTIRTVVSALNR